MWYHGKQVNVSRRESDNQYQLLQGNQILCFKNYIEKKNPSFYMFFVLYFNLDQPIHSIYSCGYLFLLFFLLENVLEIFIFSCISLSISLLYTHDYERDCVIQSIFIVDI